MSSVVRHGRRSGARVVALICAARPVPNVLAVSVSRVFVWSGVLFVVVALAFLASPAAPAASDLVVKTRSGAVAGVLNGSVKEWRGIPYAAPPVGDLRWRPPAPVTPWSGTRDATTFAQPCVQLRSLTTTIGSEDCLYLNVFVPEGATSRSRLAVMVHLHPGGNTFGQPYTQASSFAARGVVLVTLAYRLGVFGFAGHPALTAEGGGQSGEYGALDQLAALQWVHDNIAAFGGDPSRVTLFGSSAGSFDTVALMASPLSQGLIARAAVQGVAFWASTGTFNTIADREGLGIDVADGVGCSSASDVLSCLRATPADALVEAAGPLDLAGPPIGSSVLPESPLQLVGERSTVPLLVGFDREEDAAFFGVPDPYTNDDWVRDSNELVGPQRGTQARSLYPPDVYGSNLWAYLTMRTDAVRGCPTRRLANSVRAPVWRYLYTHTYENDPFFAQFRASHVLEDPLLWHADVLGFGYTLSPNEEALSKRMSDYWTNFAKTGDPNGKGLPQWPRYHTSTEPTLTLDDQIGVITNYHDQECALLDTLSWPFPPPNGK
jgi:para-nitrobenzyl esterase